MAVGPSAPPMMPMLAASDMAGCDAILDAANRGSSTDVASFDHNTGTMASAQPIAETSLHLLIVFTSSPPEFPFAAPKAAPFAPA